MGRRDRYTLVLVPPAGVGRSRRIALRPGVLAGVGLALLLLVGGLAGMAAAGSGAGELARQNRELRDRLARIEGQVARSEASLRRVRLYDAWLRRMLADVPDLPGAGPLSAEELDLVQGGDPPPPPVAASAAEALDRADALAGRAARLLEELDAAEPDIGGVAARLADLLDYEASLPGRWPVEGRITSEYGYRRGPISRERRFHEGLDISAPRGTPVHAVADGVVVEARVANGYGRVVTLDHGHGFQTRYAHNSRLLVRRGDRVREGEVIATVGSTGRATGPHLHFEVLVDGSPVDPLEYLP